MSYLESVNHLKCEIKNRDILNLNIYPQKPSKTLITLKPSLESLPSNPQNPQTLITLKPHFSLQGDGVSLLLGKGHYRTFNSDCRTINDYQTLNTTYTQNLIKFLIF